MIFEEWAKAFLARVYIIGLYVYGSVITLYDPHKGIDVVKEELNTLDQW
jgi:hypothetical protein